jgi:hypothetical protein
MDAKSDDAASRESRSQAYWPVGYGDHTARRHEGNFAVGQAVNTHDAEVLSGKGTFASGVARRPPTHQGTYAEGQEYADPHPEVLENRGGFAAGQRGAAGVTPRRGRLPSFS